MIEMIAAVAKNGVIGYKNGLPWGRIENDMRWFKSMTVGKNVVMGKNTFLSIGKPLKDRNNIVLSSDERFKHEGIHVLRRFPIDREDMIIIGGERLYREHLSMTDVLYLTMIDRECLGDAHFPMEEIDRLGFRKAIEIRSVDDLTFLKLVKPLRAR